MADLEESELPQHRPRSYYTREGDDGRTRLGGYGDVSKTDVRVAAASDCDEANAAVSVALAVGGLPVPVASTLVSVQNDLFDLVSDLSVPLDGPDAAAARIRESHVTRLERAIDHFAQDATDLSGLVLPGGTIGAAVLYQARCVVRRAERAVWLAVEQHPASMNPLAGRYLNRLSSLLFVLAREANAELGDVEWVPEASAKAMAEEAPEATGVDDTAEAPDV